MHIAERLSTSGSLLQEIAEFGQRMTHINAELVDAWREIARLQGELAEQSRAPKPPPLDFPALRRYVVFRCHPDRGGDTANMQGLNALFDFLEEAAAAAAGKGGR